MTQEGTPAEELARYRLRSLRTARGWSLDELARRSHLGPSTISRIETGHRRITLDHLVSLATALETTVDVLLRTEEVADVVIRPVRSTRAGATVWLLSRPDDPSGRVVAKMRIPTVRHPDTAKVHPGRDWIYVLSGTARITLDDHDHLLEAGQAAEFDTMIPHRIVGHEGDVEVLTIFDRHGERAHLQPSGSHSDR